MKLAHLVKLNVFCKDEDNKEELFNVFKSLLPFDLEKEKIKISRTSVGGFEHKKIIIFETILKKERHTTVFLKNLIEKINKKDRELILEQIDSRLDEEHNFFLRFDKTKLVKNNELVLTDSGDCYHIKISIAAFPAKKKEAKKLVKIIFT